MDQAEIRQKVDRIIEKYSVFGRVCDVWLSTDIMATLDPRPPMERILESPYKVGDVFVSAFAALRDNEFRVAVISSFGALDESCSGD